MMFMHHLALVHTCTFSWVPSTTWLDSQPSSFPLATLAGTRCTCPFAFHQPAHHSLSNNCTCRASRRSFATRAAAAAAGNGSGKRITQQEFTEKAWQAVVAAPEIATEYQQQVRCQ
jgi:hypothetical protein